MAGCLYIVATPIGNLDDMTIRGIRILREVDIVAAEDTRHTRILLERFGIGTPLISLHEYSQTRRYERLVEGLQKGQAVAYVSDAGTPGISDPGYVLVRQALSRGIRVVPIPGASAVMAALSVSGLPTESFVFEGFLPERPQRRRRFLLALAAERRTMVFYESPRRLLATLNDLRELWGDRQVVLAREMTKIHEEIIRGSLGELIPLLAERTIKGEVTLLVEGSSKEAECSEEELLRLGKAMREEGGLSCRQLVDRVVAQTGAPRKRVYKIIQQMFQKED